MRIIAFGHRQRVGKDTATRMMVSEIKSVKPRTEACRLGLFDWAKDTAAEIFSYAGLMDRIYYDNHPERKDDVLPSIGKSVRQIWLEFGYYLREIHSGTIPENALKSVSADIVVISDIRSVQDVEYVRKFDGWMIRLDRDVPKLESKLTGHPAYTLDSSLEDYDGWDEIWDNNGSLRDLNKRICEFVKEKL